MTPAIRLLDDSELPSILPLLRQSYPHLDETTLRRRLSELPAQNYRCAGAFIDGRLVAICGIWIRTHLWCGRMVEPDNVVVDSACRSHGIGRDLVEWVVAWGRDQGCEVSDLNCYVSNAEAHAFWMRQGWRIIGFHFQRRLEPTGP